MDVEEWEVGDIVEVIESCGGSTEGAYVAGDFLEIIEIRKPLVFAGKPITHNGTSYRIITRNQHFETNGWMSENFRWLGKGKLEDWIRVKEL